MTGTTQALHDLPAHALLRAYRERSLSPVEVMHELLAHVQRWEPALGATYLLRPEAALAQARASEARWLRGEPAGLLDGVPATVKDNIATRGDPTDRKSTRLNSSHQIISYAVFCLKKKKKT